MEAGAFVAVLGVAVLPATFFAAAGFAAAFLGAAFPGVAFLAGCRAAVLLAFFAGMALVPRRLRLVDIARTAIWRGPDAPKDR